MREISKYKPPGGLYSEGRLNGGFLRYEFGWLIFGGSYTWSSLPADVLWGVTSEPQRTSAGRLIHGGAYFRNFTV